MKFYQSASQLTKGLNLGYTVLDNSSLFVT